MPGAMPQAQARARAHHAQAIAALQGRRIDAAREAIKLAIADAPFDAELHNDEAVILQAAGMTDAAFAAQRRSVALSANDPRFIRNLGVLHRQAGDLEASGICMLAAREIAPDDVDTRYQSGLTRLRRRDAAGALAEFQACLAGRIGWFDAEVGVATALQELGRLDEAIALYRGIVLRQPELAAAHNNLGKALLNVPDVAAALESFDRALALAPGVAEIAYNRALTLLGIGNWAAGWVAHEARWQLAQPPSPRRVFDGAVPRWDGTKLAGRRLLLHAEQGLGDSLQFLRFAGVARQQGLTDGDVVLEVQRPLLRLCQAMRCQGFDRVFAQGDQLPDVDVQLPLMSLPLVLGIEAEQIPAAPFLPDRRRAPSGQIGLVWAGNPHHANDARRSLPAEWLAPLVAGYEGQIVSLQVGDRARDLAACGLEGFVARMRDPKDFADTASVVGDLDLVISVDTSTAHLAGGMGVPTWVMLPFIADWRWGCDCPTTPWYPAMRLFRQPIPGAWGKVIAAVRHALGVRDGQPGGSNGAKQSHAAAEPIRQGVALGVRRELAASGQRQIA